MMHQADLPRKLWAEAIRYAAWLKNRLPTKVLGSVTPYKRLYGTKPHLAGLPEWGQWVWVHDSSGSKLDTWATQARWGRPSSLVPLGSTALAVWGPLPPSLSLLLCTLALLPSRLAFASLPLYPWSALFSPGPLLTFVAAVVIQQLVSPHWGFSSFLAPTFLPFGPFMAPISPSSGLQFLWPLLPCPWG